MQFIYGDSNVRLTSIWHVERVNRDRLPDAFISKARYSPNLIEAVQFACPHVRIAGQLPRRKYDIVA